MIFYVIVVSHAVPKRINTLCQCPLGNRAREITGSGTQHAAVVHAIVGSVFPVVVCHAIFVSYRPPIVAGVCSMADNTVECLVFAGKKLFLITEGTSVCPLVGAVRHFTKVAVTVFSHQMLALIDIHFALLALVISRHTPARFHGDRGDGNVPAHAEPAVAAATVVGQCKVGLHSLPSCRNLYRITQVSRTVVVGRGRLHQRQPLQWIGGLQLFDARGRVGRCFWHLRSFQHRIDEI